MIMLGPHFIENLKFSRFRAKQKKNSGIILITVLWVLTILSLLAISLGRSTSVELALTKHALGRLRSKYVAWAGIIYGIDFIRRDSENRDSLKWDTLYHCARPMDGGHSPEEIFGGQTLDDVSFDIRYSVDGSEGEEKKIYYGFQDEERKININGLNAKKANILGSLIVLLGFDENTAQQIAYAAVDWKDEDNDLSDDSYGAENDYYTGLTFPYNCKNRPFESLEELLLVRGMTPEIFLKLKNHVTVFSGSQNFRLNFDTASEVVLNAIARSVTGPATNTEISDADSLVEKILSYRNGDDNEAFTKDDRQIDHNELSLNAKERVVFLAINPYRTKRSDYINIQVKGVDEGRNVETSIEAIIERDELSITYWRRK